MAVNHPNRFRQARERRGWTIFQAAQQLRGVRRQQLINLEEGTSEPCNVRVETMVALVEGYWPDLTLRDFVPDASVRLTPGDVESLRRLLRREGNAPD